MGRMGKWLPILTVAIGVASSAEASRPLRYEEIPEPLKPWSEWVTYGREAHACPFLHGHGDDGDREDLCAWPGKLELRMASSGGTFVQNWTLFTEGFVPLPGDDVHFPEDVRAGNSAAPVVMRGGRPHIYLKPGAYRIGGTFHWATLPDSLMVPEPTGLLSLVVDGKNVEAVNREASGLVWLRVGESAVAEENRVELSVYRLIADDSPLQITTRIQLRVSGKNREIRLKHPLLEGSVAWSLTSALPARLDNSGELHVQVRPGTWNVDLVARGDQPVAELTYRATDELWPAEELWSFIAHPEIRTVVVENGTAVDPQQTTLPAEWQKLPTYRLKSGEAFHLVLKQRAGAEIRPDKLSLHRVYWLDFRGGGLTFRDQITGLFQSSYRLEMPAPMHLGRVTVDGRDQLITQRKGKELSGVEIRQGAAHLAADGRIESPNGQLPVAGWLSALDHASATLYLPPGWRLFHASGVDHASNTWLGGWTLLDLFLVLLVAVATDRLWGHKWAALALVMMVLIVPEQEAPGWIWLVALALEGISRLKVADRFSGWLRRARITTLLLFLTVFLPFAIGHLRAALYPSLQSQEHGLLMLSSGQALNYSQRAQQLDTYNDQELSKFSAFGRAAKANSDGSVETPKGAIGVAPAAPPVAEPAEQERDEKTEAVEDAPSVPESRMMKRSPMPSQSSGGMGAYQPQLDFNQVDVKAAIQTGPGLPEWTGAQVALGWSGPVEASQQFRLWLVSPAMNFVLAVLRVLLLVVFLLRVFATPKLWQSLGLRRVGRVAAIMAIGASVLGGTAHAEPLPSSNQLEELKTRLLANPVCFPDCASVGRMRVESTGDALRLRVEIHAQATTGVPLPGQSEHFSVREITVDGKPAAGVRREGDGHLWLVVAPGVHQIILDAVAAKKEVVQISLPLLPHRVESQLSGWQLRGIDENGRPVGTLELVRVRTASIVGTPGQEQSLTPFARVERTLLLGLRWEMQTRVVRLTPTGAPYVAEVPLLKGESVTSGDVRVVDGRVAVNMAPSATEFSWTSRLEESEKIDLTAAKSGAWVEIWRVEAAPTWHLEWQGISPVVRNPQAAVRVPEWLPWPGEKLELFISRPEAISGSTLTVQSSEQTVTPGQHSTETLLTLRLSSSRGGEHRLKLPDGAKLESITLDGETAPLRLESGNAVFAVKPGDEEVKIGWREARGLSLFYTSGQVDVGRPSTNSATQLSLGAPRWVLWLGGPSTGPVVLFWSMLAMVVALALALAWTGWTPLGFTGWLLLAIGLAPVDLTTAMFVASFLVALAWRQKQATRLWQSRWFQLLQIVLAFWAAVVVILLVDAIKEGLLGRPQMQVVGNGSVVTASGAQLKWYADRSDAVLPRVWMISCPILVYQAAMLVWALWLASSVVRWSKWAWTAFSAPGAWRPRQGKTAAPVAPPPTNT